MSTDNQNLWDNIELKKNDFPPFYKFDMSNEFSAIISLEKPIKEYVPKSINGQYGTGNFIEIGIWTLNTETNQEEKLLYMFKIDSVRLRNEIVTKTEGIKKFPVNIKVQRFGANFNTHYKCTILK